MKMLYNKVRGIFREINGNGMLNIRPKVEEIGAKLPLVNYEEKINQARQYLISRNILDVKPVIVPGKNTVDEQIMLALPMKWG